MYLHTHNRYAYVCSFIYNCCYLHQNCCYFIDSCSLNHLQVSTSALHATANAPLAGWLAGSGQKVFNCVYNKYKSNCVKRLATQRMLSIFYFYLFYFFFFGFFDACCNILADMRQCTRHIHRRHHRQRDELAPINATNIGRCRRKAFYSSILHSRCQFSTNIVQQRRADKDSAHSDAH